MRLLSRKIYRAFPELDEFDDETCKRYISRTAGMSNTEVGCLLIISVLIVSVFAWRYIEFNLFQAIGWLLDLCGIERGSFFEMLLVLVVLSGYIWFPWLMLLLTRDRWLYGQIKKQLRGAVCRECEYCLVGLPINETRFNGFVVCPECNCENFLNDETLTREDIDPTLVSS